MSPKETVSEALAFRRRFRRWVAAVSALFVLAFALLGAVAWVVLTDDQLTPCQQDSSSFECQQTKLDSDLVRPLYSACVIPAMTGLGCPALGISPAEGKAFVRRLASGKQPPVNGDTDGPEAPGGSAATPEPNGDGGSGDSSGGSGVPGLDPTPTPTGPDSGGTDGGGGENPSGPGPSGGGPDAPAQGTLGQALGQTIDETTGLICAVTDPLTGRCIR